MGRFPRAVRLSYSLTLDTNLAEFLVGQLMRMLCGKAVKHIHARRSQLLKHWPEKRLA